MTPIVGSRYLSDGGAAFGPVPQAIWSKLIAPGSNNLIPVTADCLLVELADGRLGLVDTGCGAPAKYSEKERAFHGLHEEWYLRTAFEQRGLRFADIDFVVLTHLHWDHAGGAASPGSDGRQWPTFHRAMHFVHAREWNNAFSADPLLYKAYPETTIRPLRQLPVRSLHLVEKDDQEVLPGVRMIRSGGHTSGHCIVLLQDGSLTLDHPEAEAFKDCPAFVFASDLCPTRHHLRMAYHTAYDLFPLEARAWKREWMARIAAEKHLLFFDHDHELFGATIRPDEKKEYVVDRALPIEE
ncbi:MAG: MBL fold metallo-hydrolase [Kiritimatiellae bacterium]|nr:MBL fold metallo-hydrolase [Kiritimatiellia bacterium]